MSQNPENTASKREGFYRQFIEQSNDAMFRVDFPAPVSLSAGIDSQISGVLAGIPGAFNGAYEHLAFELCADPLADRSFSQLRRDFGLFTEESVREFLEHDTNSSEFELSVAAPDGGPRFLNATFTGVTENEHLVCVWVQIRDWTIDRQRNQMLEEIERNWRLTQKIEALGRLAGGVAHDFNNFLAVIMLQNDMLNLQLPAGSPMRYRTDEMKKATNKAAAMVKQLLAVGRKQTLAPRPTEVNALIQDFSKTLPSLLPENVEVETSCSPDAGLCFVDQKQFIHTLFSLIENSRDAMPDGGKLTLETAPLLLTKGSVLHKSQPEGWFVQITVRDSGTGMDSATLESVFEPFFSTKKSSKGVGLGLATVYGFIKQSKGFIWVESELGKGTTFRIQFPRIDQPAPASADNEPTGV